MSQTGIATRDRILDAGLDLLSASGFAGVTIGVLANHVGMSKSGLFAHFKSKETPACLATAPTVNELFTVFMFYSKGYTLDHGPGSRPIYSQRIRSKRGLKKRGHRLIRRPTYGWCGRSG